MTKTILFLILKRSWIVRQDHAIQPIGRGIREGKAHQNHIRLSTSAFCSNQNIHFLPFSLISPDSYKTLPTPVPTTLHKFPLIDVSALPIPLFLLLQTTASTNQDVSLIPWASQLTSRLCGKSKVCFPQAIWLCMPELYLLFHVVTSISLDRI